MADRMRRRTFVTIAMVVGGVGLCTLILWKRQSKKVIPEDMPGTSRRVFSNAEEGRAENQSKESARSKSARDLSKFSRPVERGENLSAFPVSELVSKLRESQDKVERQKAAKALGDRSMAGRLHLTNEEERAIGDVVISYLQQGKSNDSNERAEARQQIERLWHVAAPTLLKNVGSKDPTTAELSIKSLILMRNEQIVKGLIRKARSVEDEHTRMMAVFALKKIKERRESLIPGRKCLGEEESQILYDRLVAPALQDLKNGTGER